MDTSRWQRILTLVDAALPLPPNDRVHYLTRVCGDDAALRADVYALLEAIDASETFWEEWSAWNEGVMGELLTTLTEEETPPDRPPQTIGAWRVIEPLGRGGMGSVYRVERADGLFEQQAALKLMHRGLLGESVRRFDQERRILARLDHPNIARLYDGGVTEDGRPWLAMELVDGVSITDWCRQQNASLNQRLDLFTQVCEAVRYAHRNLIVHRDLKPDNILVTGTAEGRIRVKVLDFGIAKLLDEEASPSERILTRTGVRVMSLDYAAPEQIAGEPVTTATDVYTLGLLLYELLADAYPFDLEGKNVRQIERLLREQEPPRPSVRFRSANEEAPARAVWQQALRGDLDAIALKALRKEPEQRYESAAQLLDDLLRHRHHLPVTARRDSLRYRVSKFARRHTRALMAVAAVALLIGGLIAYYSIRVTQERDAAQREAAKAEQVSAFLVDLFEASDPGEARGESITARKLLERGSARIEAELANEPIVQAAMLDILGAVYQKLGQYAEAQSHLERAVALRRQLLPSTHPDLAESLNKMGVLLLYRGRTNEAESYLREALTIYRRVPEDEPDQVASTLSNLAAIHLQRNHLDSAEVRLREAIALRRKRTPEDGAKLATNLDGLAVTLERKGNAAEAEALYREAMEIRRRHLGADHPDYARSLNNVASFLLRQNNPAGADSLFREALAIWRNVLDGDHPDIATALNNLAAAVERQGDLDAAEPLYRESLSMKRRLLGNEHASVARSLNNLGLLLQAREDYVAAEPLLLESLDVRRAVLEAHHPDVAQALFNLGELYTEMQAFERAEPLYREALAIRREAHPADHWRIAEAQSALGACLAELGHLEEAESLLVDAYEVLRRNDRPVRATLERLIQFYERRRDANRVATYRKLLAEATY